MKKLILTTALISTLGLIGMEEVNYRHDADRLGTELAALTKDIREERSRNNPRLTKLTGFADDLVDLRSLIAAELTINKSQTMIKRWNDSLLLLTTTLGSLPATDHPQIIAWLLNQTIELNRNVSRYYANSDRDVKRSIETRYQTLNTIKKKLDFIDEVDKIRINSLLDTTITHILLKK